MKKDKAWDAIIIGGSYAGLSAAMSLGRSLRRTLIIDDEQPCNRQTPHSHNFLTQDGRTPKEIATLAQSQVMSYPDVSRLQGSVVRAKKYTEGFSVETADGQIFETKKLILAGGIQDLLPSIPGLAACWGITAIHCPYCHGYEFRTKETAILADGDRAFHLAGMVRNLTANLTLITSPKHFNEVQLAQLKRNQISILDVDITAIQHDAGKMSSLELSNGDIQAVDALYVAAPFVQRDDIYQQLGCALTENGYIKVDGFQKTSTDGVYACGDNSSMMRSVATAVYTGNLTGAMVNRELVEEEFNREVI
ncbi:NAD(P)/FAD-dependent oxidoreductase [Sphingobacterium griseoflavum]|uniref:FAD/NAD(P)-binding domain-containing protein n=1 Tax=Sphingobacterium griseoflavum TaxID=1474952 RepID=A0ABQ3HV33_9SPHI|nr:NAD(P)/FAD-dependent oxidoreductase [Sphingobacterium griseoflavum]GHE23337.1 hypothetical protein GCM10017764_03050 [Sphingobacterium griseoflavum]